MAEINEKNLNDYKQIRDLVVMMTKELDDLKNTYASSLYATTGAPFTKEVFDIVLPYTLDYIKTDMEPSKMKEVIGPFEIINGGAPSVVDSSSDDRIRETMVTIKSLSLVILKLENELASIKADASNVMNEYITYLSTNQLLKDKEEKLKLLRDANDVEIDDNAKRVNDRTITILENQISYKFLTERIDEFGYKEKVKLMDKFFDANKGHTVVTKFKNKAKQFGYNPEIFSYFLNIEENFLPEEYHPFNNFFLSGYMNFVGFCSIDINADKIYLATITSAIASLIYHSFPTPEDETKFIEFIKSYLDRFKDDPEHGAEIVDRFKMDNRSYSKHPDRIKADKMSADIKRNTVFKRLEELNIENPFDDDCDVNEAITYMNEKVAELKASQIPDAEKLEAEENENLDLEKVEQMYDEFSNQANGVREKLDAVESAEEDSAPEEVNDSNDTIDDIESPDDDVTKSDLDADAIASAVDSLYDEPAEDAEIKKEED